MATRPHTISAYRIANPLRVILKRMSEGRTFCAFTCEAIRHGDQPVRSTPDVAALKMGIKNVHRPLARITNEDRFPALFKNFISREYIFSASCPHTCFVPSSDVLPRRRNHTKVLASFQSRVKRRSLG